MIPVRKGGCIVLHGQKHLPFPFPFPFSHLNFLIP